MRTLRDCIVSAVIGVVLGCLAMIVMGMFHPMIAVSMACIGVVEVLAVGLGAGNSKTKVSHAEVGKVQTA